MENSINLNIINDFPQKIEDRKTDAKPLVSKTMLKKLKRQEEWESKKKTIRKIKKTRKKEKKLLEKEKSKNDQSNIIEEKIINLPRTVRKEQYLSKLNEGIKLILDCGFEELMNEKDMISIVRQITECYSLNRKAEKPFNFILYDIGEKMMELLIKNNYSNWLGMKVVKKGEYASIDKYIIKIFETNNLSVNINSNELYIINAEEIKKKIIYLSADSENEINVLKGDEIYIIGGIVDRNRYKMLSFNKANELGINHGKLPIGDYIQLKSSKVLTTNHVFAILSYFNNTKCDWKEAFLSIIPKRKFDENK